MQFSNLFAAGTTILVFALGGAHAAHPLCNGKSSSPLSEYHDQLRCIVEFSRKGLRKQGEIYYDCIGRSIVPSGSYIECTRGEYVVYVLTDKNCNWSPFRESKLPDESSEWEFRVLRRCYAAQDNPDLTRSWDVGYGEIF